MSTERKDRQSYFKDASTGVEEKRDVEVALTEGMRLRLAGDTLYAF